MTPPDLVVTDIDVPKRPRGRPRKTVDERDDGNRRHELLKVAAQLFRRKGFAATTTRDIAAAAGMQSGSPFYHFKSKDALLFAVMEEGMHTALANQHAALSQPGYAEQPPAAQLAALVHTHFAGLLGPGNDFVPVMLYEWRSLNSRQRKLLAQLIADYEALWMPVLEALHTQGQLKAPVKLARLLMLGALNWSVQWFDAKKGASVEELGDAAMALFLKES
ncbi:TetR/AcrR family transcriptional regulator [Rhodoferax saidenbachensis]|uniref:AcrR family transcriptional regulator n=1 Tax=Rhodoferax saidenbachensis TaxID=1484693 RepID=A0ABU1ZKC4_9BURK|nr:TetR/AcrR family transcriptional regulator [Rhodoferax saidenbachensis]MDR7306005.1 AcrR family transcriptional regulator [Rhodoferax saidenbachensis]